MLHNIRDGTYYSLPSRWLERGLLFTDCFSTIARRQRDPGIGIGEGRVEPDRAIAKHPVKWNYHATKSRWLHDLGRTQEAVAEKRLAESLKPLEPDYLQARQEQATNRTEGEP